MITAHLGLHKTGTTSIQTVLGISQGHIRRKQRYLRWTSLFVTDGEVNWEGAQDIRRLTSRGWHVVVSSEGGLGSMETMYETGISVVEQLEDFFGPENLQVVVYLRPHLQWIESAYGQHVEEGGTLLPAEFYEKLSSRGNFSHSKFAEDLLVIGQGGVRFRPYVGGDVVEDFYEVAELGTVPEHLRHMRARPSRSAREVMIKRQCNESNESPANAGEAPSIKESVFSSRIQKSLWDHFVQDWTQLADTNHLHPQDRHDFLQVMDNVEPLTVRPTCPQEFAHVKRHEDADASGADPQIASTSVNHRASRDRILAALRHGPRLALLKMISGEYS